jgi:dienelactone hydrolase
MKREISIPLRAVTLNGELTMPSDPRGLTLFAHGSGSSRLSPRNQVVAGVLQQEGVGTLLFDLLTEREEEREYYTRHLRFDIGLLADRLLGAAQWVSEQPEAQHLRLGLFGSSTGAAAALIAASKLGDAVGAVVSRGGRPDLAGTALDQVSTPTLFIVGGHDEQVLELNREALVRLRGEKQLEIVPNATHLFEEPGALEQVSRLAANWFRTHLHPVGVGA